MSLKRTLTHVNIHMYIYSVLFIHKNVCVYTCTYMYICWKLLGNLMYGRTLFPEVYLPILAIVQYKIVYAYWHVYELALWVTSNKLASYYIYPFF